MTPVGPEILVVSALSRELPERPARGVLASALGIGRAAGPALADLLARYQPAAVLSVGFAGGLRSDLGSGSLLVCERLRTPEADDPTLSPEDPALVEATLGALRHAGLPAQSGTLLTVDSVLRTPAERANAFRSTGASVVDMEGYWLARAVEDYRTATGQRLPFLALRAVLDALGHTLPAFIERITAQHGRRQLREALRALLRHPALLPDLVRFGLRARRARRRLGQAAHALTPLLTPGPGQSR